MLHARGQRATPQRYAILRELRLRDHHATAEEIGRSVRAQLPGTSVPTVYATLELLVELGLVRRIDTGLGPALYDGGTEPHQHMVCRRCGAVQDLPVRAGGRPAARRRRSDRLCARRRRVGHLGPVRAVRGAQRGLSAGAAISPAR